MRYFVLQREKMNKLSSLLSADQPCMNFSSLFPILFQLSQHCSNQMFNIFSPSISRCAINRAQHAKRKKHRGQKQYLPHVVPAGELEQCKLLWQALNMWKSAQIYELC